MTCDCCDDPIGPGFKPYHEIDGERICTTCLDDFDAMATLDQVQEVSW